MVDVLNQDFGENSDGETDLNVITKITILSKGLTIDYVVQCLVQDWWR